MAEHASFEIQDHSAAVIAAFNSQMDVALEAIGQQAESHAKQVITDTLVYGGIDVTQFGEHDNSRVDTGAMRNSVSHTVNGESAYIGTNLDYAVYHELGTGIYASQPGGRKKVPWYYTGRDGKRHRTSGLYPIHFLKKAASEHTDEYKKIIETVMKGKQP